ncbi:MAG: biotin/lipoyl-binding protein [Balneolaceae bacterium]
MNRIVKRILTAVLILVVLGIIAYPKVQPLFSSSSETVESSGSGSLLQVEGVRLQPERIEDKIYASGTLQANEVVDLRAEVSGKIMEIHFEEGRPVEAGELLLKINDSELQAQKRRAQFQLNLAVQREERQERLLERGGISQED